MKIFYFAWLKEHTLCSSEIINPPKKIATVNELVDFLKTLSPGHQIALQNMKTVRIAVNQEYASLETAIKSTDEIAFFPPVTGG